MRQCQHTTAPQGCLVHLAADDWQQPLPCYQHAGFIAEAPGKAGLGAIQPQAMGLPSMRYHASRQVRLSVGTALRLLLQFALSWRKFIFLYDGLPVLVQTDICSGMLFAWAISQLNLY